MFFVYAQKDLIFVDNMCTIEALIHTSFGYLLTNQLFENWLLI